jgi:hypothetical protein
VAQQAIIVFLSNSFGHPHAASHPHPGFDDGVSDWTSVSLLSALLQSQTQTPFPMVLQDMWAFI